MSLPKRIAVIGAGASGLTAIKACLEEGLEASCFERSGEPGGLWRYREEDVEGVSSVMQTTIINTSKEMSAYSDFPPPSHFPNFMHNSLMLHYLMSYAQSFDLLRHIRYHQEVVKVEPAADYDATGSWRLTTRDSKTDAESEEEFDGVLVCVGHHVHPKVPTFLGQEAFRGSVTHTHGLKRCERYAGQRVAVVGIGNSSADATVDCAYVAKQVYLSTRRGSWISSRVGPRGRPFDVDAKTRKIFFLNRFRSFDSICTAKEKSLNQWFDHAAYRLRPKHRVLSAHPTINDSLPNCILSGKVVVKGDVIRFEENGILFEGDDQVTEVDAVVLATGYDIRLPFLNENLVSTQENKLRLYKYAIPPQLKHHTLAIIGLVQPIGPLLPVSEMVSRWSVQIFTGKLRLPSADEMQKDIDDKIRANCRRYVASTRHTIQVDWIPFLDDIASQIGAKPNLVKMAFTDPKLFWTCFVGPALPYQYRLQGPHSWLGARDAILNFEERLYAPLKTRPEEVLDEFENRSLIRHILTLTMCGAVVSALILKYTATK